jgi:hypothetical protein
VSVWSKFCIRFIAFAFIFLGALLAQSQTITPNPSTLNKGLAQFRGENSGFVSGALNKSYHGDG